MNSVFHYIAAVLAAASLLRAGEREDWTNKMRPIAPLGYVCRHASQPIAVDGEIDEAAWKDAPWTTDFVDIEGDAKPKPRFRTRAKMLWDETYLYIAAELEEPQVWATLRQHDMVIFQDPDFEVFIDPDGDTHAYGEFEMNALNTTWDLFLPKPYQDQGSPHNEWEIVGAKTAVRVHGTINNPTDQDVGWTVEIAFPWKAFAAMTRHPGPPQEGEQWRINFSRVEWRIAVENGVYRKIPDTPEDNWVWSPQGVIDMHRPEMWGLLQFSGKPATEAVRLTPIQGKSARDVALEVYYAQRDFQKDHGRWAATLEQLGWSRSTRAEGTDGPVLNPTDTGYSCRVGFEQAGVRGEWTIREDRMLILNTGGKR